MIDFCGKNSVFFQVSVLNWLYAYYSAQRHREDRGSQRKNF